MLERSKIEILWQDPLDLAQKISDNYRDESWVFLYSGLNEKSNEKLDEKNSYLAIFPREKIICEDFFAAEKILKSSEERWFGYFSYEVAHDFEKFPKTKKSLIDLPKIWLVNFDLVFEFDHKKKKLMATFSDKKLLEKVTRWTFQQDKVDRISSSEFLSNFTDSSYLKTISKIKEMIARGDLYQTNLTRKCVPKRIKP